MIKKWQLVAKGEGDGARERDCNVLLNLPVHSTWVLAWTPGLGGVGACYPSVPTLLALFSPLLSPQVWLSPQGELILPASTLSV